MLSTALKLLQFVPEVLGLFDNKRGQAATEAMNKVTEVAEALTGKSGDDAVKALSANPQLAFEFKMAVMADKHVHEQLQAEDLKNARDAYKVHHEQADEVAKSIMGRNLPTVFFLVLCNIFAVMYARYIELPGELVAVISNLIGVVIGQLLSERQSVVGFFFGSSLGSKMKNK